MHYPIVICEDGTIHAVRDETKCVCDRVYRCEVPCQQKELYKQIYFRNLKWIDCEECKKALREKYTEA